MNDRRYGKADDEFARIETLIVDLERAGDNASASAARELVALVLELHRGGLARLIDLVADSADLDALSQRMAEDEAVRSLLLLHGLHPEPLADRIGRALTILHAPLGVHGLTVGSHELDGNRLRLALSGETDGMAGVLRGLPGEIEAALFALAPELEAVVIDHPQLPLARPQPADTAGGHFVLYRSRALELADAGPEERA